MTSPIPLAGRIARGWLESRRASRLPEPPVDPVLIDECVAIDQQAPSGGNQQDRGFVVVTNPGTKAALANLYRWARDETSPTLADGETVAYLAALPAAGRGSRDDLIAIIHSESLVPDHT